MPVRKCARNFGSHHKGHRVHEVCRDIFNLSNHAMGNAENVLLIRDEALAKEYEEYIQRLMAAYATPRTGKP